MKAGSPKEMLEECTSIDCSELDKHRKTHEMGGIAGECGRRLEPRNGTDSPEIGQGLLDFSPTATVGQTLGTLTIPPGTTIKEIDITFAVVPSVCSGANYAIEFDNGTGGGLKTITQNTAFKFLFSSTYTVPSTATITLLFGQIVNGMAGLGSGLDNSTIQTVNVGQAR